MNKRLKNIFFILSLMLFVINVSVFAQKNCSKDKKIVSTKIVSAGIVNGKAIKLAKPKFPQTASMAGIYGVVSVSIIIDEKGCVIEAKATSGHGLLKPNSVKAALDSTFTPLTLNEKPVKVRGVIIYNYIPVYYNWLEIGFSIKNSDIWKKMPKGFKNQKEFFDIYQGSSYKTKRNAFDNLIASIEGKLSENEKHLWLFRIGRVLREIDSYEYQLYEDKKRSYLELDKLLLNSPNNISPNFISKLKNISILIKNPKLNTISQIKGSKLNEALTEIKALMPMFGR